MPLEAEVDGGVVAGVALPVTMLWQAEVVQVGESVLRVIALGAVVVPALLIVTFPAQAYPLYR